MINNFLYGFLDTQVPSTCWNIHGCSFHLGTPGLEIDACGLEH